MAYCTQADLVLRFGTDELVQLTDKDGELGAVDTGVLEQAIADADAEIDGYLADGGYTLPLSTVPARIKRHSCAIARYYLYDNRRPDVVQQGYDRALNWLEGVASGKIKLGDEERDASTSPGIAAPTRTMTYDDDWADQYNQ